MESLNAGLLRSWAVALSAREYEYGTEYAEFDRYIRTLLRTGQAIEAFSPA